jgi:hypothetical protein
MKMNEVQVTELQDLMERFKEHDECLKAHRHSTEKGPPIEKLKTLVNLLYKWVKLYEKLQEVVKNFSPIYGEISRLKREDLKSTQLNVTYVQDKWDPYCKRMLSKFIMFAEEVRDDKVEPLQGIDMAGQLDDRTQWIADLISKLEKGAKKIEQHLAEGNKGDLHDAISALHYEDLEDADGRIYTEMATITDNLRNLLRRV